ncbi:MAG: hypothetical protein QM635_07665 [Microbacteriaceae bacterium]
MRQLTTIDPIPEGSVLLHIGPPKTGSTSLQEALFQNRDRLLAEHGVHYPPTTRHPRPAYAAVSYEVLPTRYHPSDIKRWDRLAAAVRSSPGKRIVLSSETVSNASTEQARRIVEDLGGRVSIAISLRPLSQLLASRWQQHVKEQMTLSYPNWLRQVFDENSEIRFARQFWHRYRIDDVAARWAPVIGEENITLVVLDPADRGRLFGSFEALLDLPAGALTTEQGTLNTSIPYPTVEVMRRFNRRFNRAGLPRQYYVRSVEQSGIDTLMTSPAIFAERLPIGTPDWAIERANAEQQRMNEALRATDVGVIGDLDTLIAPATTRAATGVPDTVPVEAAAEFAFAMFMAAQEFKPRPTDEPADGLPLRRVRWTLQHASRRELARALASSLRRGARGR